MKKYIVMAFLPILFQGDIHCSNSYADLNKAIQSQLISAKRAMNNISVPLDVDVILPTLLSFVEKKRMSRAVAIDKIKAIKIALEEYKLQHTTWSWWFGSNSKIITDQINPALTKVNNALKELKADSISSGYIAGGSVIGIAALAAAAYAVLYTLEKTFFNYDAPAAKVNISDDSSSQKHAEELAADKVEAERPMREADRANDLARKRAEVAARLDVAATKALSEKVTANSPTLIQAFGILGLGENPSVQLVNSRIKEVEENQATVNFYKKDWPDVAAAIAVIKENFINMSDERLY